VDQVSGGGYGGGGGGYGQSTPLVDDRRREQAYLAGLAQIQAQRDADELERQKAQVMALRQVRAY
jgi:hypothetical protein